MALRLCVCQGIFRASIAPHTEAIVAASNISYCFCKDIESWCPYVGETMGAQLNMGVLDYAALTTHADSFFMKITSRG